LQCLYSFTLLLDSGHCSLSRNPPERIPKCRRFTWSFAKPSFPRKYTPAIISAVTKLRATLAMQPSIPPM
jgi:hypothetical protein